MKRALPLLLFAGLLVMLAASCTKYVETPSHTPGIPVLSGRWYLQNASRYDGYKWQTISTGYESGSFLFAPNGNLSYADAIGPLQGSWSMYPVNDGYYYDGSGHYIQGYHVMFSLRLYEAGNASPVADWLFDDNDYNGSNVFSATYTTGSITYVFTFARE